MENKLHRAICHFCAHCQNPTGPNCSHWSRLDSTWSVQCKSCTKQHLNDDTKQTGNSVLQRHTDQILIYCLFQLWNRRCCRKYSSGSSVVQIENSALCQSGSDLDTNSSNWSGSDSKQNGICGVESGSDSTPGSQFRVRFKTSGSIWALCCLQYTGPLKFQKFHSTSPVSLKLWHCDPGLVRVRKFFTLKMIKFWNLEAVKFATRLSRTNKTSVNLMNFSLFPVIHWARFFEAVILCFRFGDLYEWNKVTTCVHNILSGRRRIEHYGEITIRNTKSIACLCKLTFVKVQLISKQESVVICDDNCCVWMRLNTQQWLTSHLSQYCCSLGVM